MTRTGFTLIEMLVATALAGLLMLAVLAVTASLASSQAVMRRPQQLREPLGRFAALLERDLVQAHDWQAGDNTLTLTGHSHTDAESLATQHRPVRVVYHVKRAADRPWLVRTQTNLDELTNRNTATQLVLPDVAALRVEPLPGDAVATSRPSDVQRRDEMPAAVRVTIVWTDTETPPWARDLLIR